MTRLTTPLMIRSLSNRRGFLAGLGALAFVPGAVFALTTAQASTLVNQVVTDINRAIASGKTGSALYRDFEAIFMRYADNDWLAASVLGASRRGLSNEKLREFSVAFRGYIARKYGRQFREFEGSTIDVTNASVVNRYVEVAAVARRSGRSPINLTFLISDREGKRRFFDVRIEGVSLRLTERDEIGALLDQRGGNIDQLIAHLQSL